MNPVITALSVLPISTAFLRQLLPRRSHDSSLPSDAARLLTARLLAIVVAARESIGRIRFFTWRSLRVCLLQTPSNASALRAMPLSVLYSPFLDPHTIVYFPIMIIFSILSARDIIYPVTSDHFILCLTLTNNEDAIIHYVTLCVFLNWKGRKGLFIIVFTHTIVLRISLIKLQLKRRESTEKYQIFILSLFIYF